MKRALALVVLLLAAACGSDRADTTVTLRLVTHDSYAVSDSVFATFEAETGIHVEVLQSGDAGAAVNQAILTKDHPQGDVLFGVDNTFLSRALDAGLFRPHEAAGLDGVDPALVLDPEHRVTPVDIGDVCLNVDIAALADADLAAPRTLDDLIEPAYDGTLVVENPATSSPGLAFLLATVAEYGDGWTDYWQALVDNHVQVEAGWEEAYYGAFSGPSSEGDRPLVVSYASSPPAEVFFAEDDLAEAPTASVPATCFRQIEFAGVLAGTAHPAEAGQLVDFLLSDTFQSDIPLNMFVFPVTDVALPTVFTDHTELAEDPYAVPPAEIAERRDELIAQWTEIVLR